jgi:N4-(beta-N-acetylglucosaminyl)-L-asparaginase
MSITRREFVQSAAGLAALTATGGVPVLEQTGRAEGGAAGAGGLTIISSGNGTRTCTKAAELIQSGTHPLDAIIAGINIVEDDPTDHSVGYGGLPNEEGVVELDASVMDGATHKAGAVAALQRVKNPSSVALLVMRRSDHVLLVGEGALKFARAHGFKEQDLLTDDARQIWLKWKETHSKKDDWLPPEPEQGDEEGARRFPADGPEFTYGTITCMALTDTGHLCGCTSTSGLSYKLPGRVGDSPIIGAGLFVDNEVGAAGSTGRGEANLQNCSSFLIVELMRAGRTPEEAAMEVLRRIAARSEKRLLESDGKPKFGLTFYAIRKDGLVGGATMLGKGGKLAVWRNGECNVVELPPLFAS